MGSDSVADWCLRRRYVGLRQGRCFDAMPPPRLAEGEEQVLIAVCLSFPTACAALGSGGDDLTGMIFDGVSTTSGR
ncbi:unnamed protein product [Soboliphyme baturini]|uniref:Uncharacterized protein n=1 Tax=Soboliphyme baturini TaxID=241478 RepID=A0A183IJV2_9BILA|nr:unnamed protein product [Soboliphyme baturini]